MLHLEYENHQIICCINLADLYITFIFKYKYNCVRYIHNSLNAEKEKKYIESRKLNEAVLKRRNRWSLDNKRNKYWI